MYIIYQEHIEFLEKENEKLKKQIHLLKLHIESKTENFKKLTKPK